MEYTTDKNALEDARRLVEEAVAILMRAITPAGCPGVRHQIAIREVASVLSDQTERYGMDADLTS
jgi:hypothetical protein